MGNGILSRAGSGDGYKIGDIVLSTENSLGEKWALCNGDPVTGGGISSELMGKLANPMNSSCWNTLWTESHSSNLHYRLLYNNKTGKYYIVELSGLTVSIYSVNGTDKNLIASKTFSESVFIDEYPDVYNESANITVNISDFAIIPDTNKIAILIALDVYKWGYDEYDNYFEETYQDNYIQTYDIMSNIFSSFSSIYLTGSSYYYNGGYDDEEGNYVQEIYEDTSYEILPDPFSSSMNTIRYNGGHSCFGIGKYLVLIGRGVYHKWVPGIFVLDSSDNFSQVDYDYFDFDITYEWNDEDYCYENSTDKIPIDMEISNAYTDKYLALSIKYELWDSINDGSGLNNNSYENNIDIFVINTNTGQIKSHRIFSRNTEQGYHSYFRTYLHDDFRHARIFCKDYENNIFGLLYFHGHYKPVPYSSDDNSYYTHVYGIIDPITPSTSIYTQKISFSYGTLSSSENVYNINNRFQVACINDEFYGIWFGNTSKIIKIDSIDSLNLDNTISGYISIDNIANYKTNSGDFIPYNGGSIILDGGSVYYYGFSPSLPTVNKDGINGFIKVKN